MDTNITKLDSFINIINKLLYCNLDKNFYENITNIFINYFHFDNFAIYIYDSENKIFNCDYKSNSTFKDRIYTKDFDTPELKKKFFSENIYISSINNFYIEKINSTKNKNFTIVKLFGKSRFDSRNSCNKKAKTKFELDKNCNKLRNINDFTINKCLECAYYNYIGFIILEYNKKNNIESSKLIQELMTIISIISVNYDNHILYKNLENTKKNYEENASNFAMLYLLSGILNSNFGYIFKINTVLEFINNFFNSEYMFIVLKKLNFKKEKYNKSINDLNIISPILEQIKHPIFKIIAKLYKDIEYNKIKVEYNKITYLSEYIDINKHKLSLDLKELQISFLEYSNNFLAILVFSKLENIESKKELLMSMFELIAKSLMIEKVIFENKLIAIKLKNIIESINSGIITIDLDGNILNTNNSLKKVLKIRTDILNKNIYKLNNPKIKLITNILKNRKNRSTFFKNIEYKSKTGNKYNYRIAISKLINNKKVEGFTIVIDDFTKLKRLEEKYLFNEKLASIGRLTSGVAHEMRNPLNPIKGFAQLIQMNLEKKQQIIEYTDIIISQVDKLKNIINQLLDFTKDIKINLQKHSIIESINAVLKVLSLEAKQENIDIIKEYNCDIEFLFDNEKIEQVIFNIIKNAIEAFSLKTINKKWIKISIKCHKKHLEIKISNNAKKITKEQAKKLFEPFFTTKIKGTGLGLSVSYGIIKKHNGDIFIDDNEKHTTFVINLPITKE